MNLDQAIQEILNKHRPTVMLFQGVALAMEGAEPGYAHECHVQLQPQFDALSKRVRALLPGGTGCVLLEAKLRRAIIDAEPADLDL